MTTSTIERAKRFKHLSAGQRNQIFRELDKFYWSSLRQEGRARELARKFGVTKRVVMDVYEHLATKHHEEYKAKTAAILVDFG